MGSFRIYPPLLILFLGALVSCSSNDGIHLPEQEALSSGPNYAVAVEQYVRVHGEPSRDSVVAGHLRRGDVATITSHSIFVDDINDVLSRWYAVEGDAGSGWVFGGYLSLFDRLSQAENAAASLE